MSNKLEEARKIINEVDAQMAELFVKRMRAAELVCEHKMEFGLPILDQKREDAVIEQNSALVEDKVLKGYYIDYQKHLMSLSRAYQHCIQSGLRLAHSAFDGAIHINLDEDSYDILVERGILKNASEHLNLNRRALIVTDSGVPEQYAKIVAVQRGNNLYRRARRGLKEPRYLWQTASDDARSRLFAQGLRGSRRRRSRGRPFGLCSFGVYAWH